MSGGPAKSDLLHLEFSGFLWSRTSDKLQRALGYLDKLYSGQEERDLAIRRRLESASAKLGVVLAEEL